MGEARVTVKFTLDEANLVEKLIEAHKERLYSTIKAGRSPATESPRKFQIRMQEAREEWALADNAQKRL